LLNSLHSWNKIFKFFGYVILTIQDIQKDKYT